MKSNFRSSIGMRILFLLIIVFLTLYTQKLSAQADTLIQEPEKSHVEQGSVSQVLGELYPELGRIRELAKSQDELRTLDSLARDGELHLDTISADLQERMEQFSMNSLENKRTEWRSYDQLVLTYEKRLKAAMDLLNVEVDFLSTNQRLWRNTITKIEESETGTELLDDIEVVLDTIQAIKSDLGTEIDGLLRVQKSLSVLRQRIQEDIQLIEAALSKSRLSIIQQNSPAIWNSIDSASAWSNFRENFRESIRENTTVLDVYLEANRARSIALIFLFLVLTGLFIVIQRYRKRYYKASAILHRQASIILSYPLISSFALSFLAIVFIYPDRPLVLTKVMVLALSIPLFMVIPRIFPERRLNLVFYVLISLYIVNFIQYLVPSTSIYYRFILLIENLALIWCFFQLYLMRYKVKHVAKFWGAIVIRSALPVTLILIITFIGNIAGFVRFSDYIVTALISITYIGLLITLVVLILQVVSVFLVEIRVDQGMDKKLAVNMLRRIFRLIKLGGIILWIRVILINLGLFHPMMRWYRILMDTSWMVGTVVISLGGIISFIVIIIITYLLSRWIKKFFKQDYRILSGLPKGVPAAISMISRYIIVTFGIYIALSAAGVDLGKFGLIAGALGVGIGFGLQNVVYNFISGLIITIERPIHVGDTVEVGTLMGNVTEIGVRASKVKTFEGSEVIVPNGNLISNEVVNWTLSDQKRRLKILVKTEMGVDPRKVLKIMYDEARKHPNTLKEPNPMALFDGYGSSSLDFTLYFWVFFNVSFTTKSDVALAIYDALEKEGIGLPVPMQRYYSGDTTHPIEPQDKP